MPENGSSRECQRQKITSLEALSLCPQKGRLHQRIAFDGMVNPMLTIIVSTLRIADRIRERL